MTTDSPKYPPLPAYPGVETLGQMIDEAARLLGWRGSVLDGCMVVGYPRQIDALERRLGDVASLKALVDGLRGQVQAAEVLIGAIRDELGAKKGDDLLEALRERKEFYQTQTDAREATLMGQCAAIDEMDAEYRALKSTMDLAREALGVPHGHDLIRWVKSTNDYRRQVEAELDEVSEILSHGVDKPGTASEMARTLLERVTAAEPILSWIDKTIGRTEDETHDEALGRYLKNFKRESVGRHNGFGEPVAPKTAAEVNKANTLRVVSPLVALKYATAGSSGIDLPLIYGAQQGEWLMPGETKVVNTGVKVQIPPGFEGQIRPRSSSAKKGLLVHLGTIDADYRGEVAVVLTNTRKCAGSAADDSARAFWLKDKEKVAQLVIVPVARPQIVHVVALDETERGEGGFGSTGR